LSGKIAAKRRESDPKDDAVNGFDNQAVSFVPIGFPFSL
jgi:hypothetical protein